MTAFFQTVDGQRLFILAFNQHGLSIIAAFVAAFCVFAWGRVIYKPSKDGWMAWTVVGLISFLSLLVLLVIGNGLRT